MQLWSNWLQTTKIQSACPPRLVDSTQHEGRARSRLGLAGVLIEPVADKFASDREAPGGG